MLLQTLQCVVRNGENHRTVRVLLGPGSQKSSILEKSAQKFEAEEMGEVKLYHLLFGDAICCF